MRADGPFPAEDGRCVALRRGRGDGAADAGTSGTEESKAGVGSCRAADGQGGAADEDEDAAARAESPSRSCRGRALGCKRGVWSRSAGQARREGSPCRHARRLRSPRASSAQSSWCRVRRHTASRPAAFAGHVQHPESHSRARKVYVTIPRKQGAVGLGWTAHPSAFPLRRAEGLIHPSQCVAARRRFPRYDPARAHGGESPRFRRGSGLHGGVGDRLRAFGVELAKVVNRPRGPGGVGPGSSPGSLRPNSRGHHPSGSSSPARAVAEGAASSRGPETRQAARLQPAGEEEKYLSGSWRPQARSTERGTR
jgi:hypothetical protein